MPRRESVRGLRFPVTTMFSDFWNARNALRVVSPRTPFAAPQIAVPLRVVIFGVSANPRYPGIEPVPDTVLINPELRPLSDEEEEGWEGCLSVPGMRGWVPRFKKLEYAGFDEHGERFEREVDGFHARVVQHEVDHLDGILYPMRIRDFTRFGFNEALFPGQELPREE